MPTAYSRVTVVNGGRRVDLALPSALPLSEVLPQLLGYCAPDSPPDRPVGWTLARLGGSSLSLSNTLAEAGVTDGEVLELRTDRDQVHPAYVEDVRDVLEDRMDQTARPWQPATTIAFSLAAGGVGLALAVGLPQVWIAQSVPALITAVAVAALLLAAGWWAGRLGQPPVAWLLIAVAAGWGAVAGWLAATFPDWPAAAMVGSALVGALLVCAIARALTPAATAHVATVSLLAGAGIAVGVTALAGVDPLGAVRVIAVAAVVAVGVLPRVSLTVGGLASADYRVRNHGLITGAELARRIEQSGALLYGGLVGVSIAGVASGVLLAMTGSIWDRLLGTVVGLVLVLRSRVFSRIPQILPLRIAGLAVVVVHGVQAAQQLPELVAWVVPIGAVAVALVAAISAVPLSDVARARVKQLLNRVELVLVVAVVTLAVAALGGFAWVAQFSPS